MVRVLPVWQYVLRGSRQCDVPSDTCAVFCAPRLFLGPLLFLLYTAELAELAARFGVTLHAFADDNQLYLKL